jgi:hypothetical protein
MRYVLEISTEDEPEEFMWYANAVAALDRWTRELRAEGWDVDASIASRDNLSAARATRAGSADRTAQIVKAEMVHDPT